MTETVTPTSPALMLPDHTQLPDRDDNFVKNLQEHPQSILLTDAITPVLQRLHPDHQYCIGQDSGIYWRLTDPPERGAEAPDWFYVPHVPPTLDGKIRRSYVLWQEYVAPLIVLEFVSGTGAEERDRTPPSALPNNGDTPERTNKSVGKFWVYEQAIRVPYYGIYDVVKAEIEVYHLVGNAYERMPANARGHYPIPPMGVELGLWQGEFLGADLPWMRWWDQDGTLLPTGNERAIQEHQRAEQESQRAEQESQRAEQESQRAEQESQRAERERQRAERLADRLRAAGLDPDAD
jgi:Uma2 family endonuclease